MAEGLDLNGFGKIISCELDPVVFAKANTRIAQSQYAARIDMRNESSLEMHIPEPIDLLFSDSDISIRESEIRRFLPLMKPDGIILMHDASSHLRIVRDAALRLQTEKLISVVFLPTPPGTRHRAETSLTDDP